VDEERSTLSITDDQQLIERLQRYRKSAVKIEICSADAAGAKLPQHHPHNPWASGSTIDVTMTPTRS